MTTDPIRLLDDPSATLELREVMLGQDRPDALPMAQRRAVERRIAASVLALPLSMKVGGLLSHGTASAGGGTAASGAVSGGAVAGTTTGSAAAGSAAAGSAAAGSAAAGSAAAGSGAAASGVWATGAAGAVGGSVAPVVGVGGALAKVTLTAVGAKGLGGTLLGALSAKGAAVLGLALATGTGASYVARDVIAERSAPAATSSEHGAVGANTTGASAGRTSADRRAPVPGTTTRRGDAEPGVARATEIGTSLADGAASGRPASDTPASDSRSALSLRDLEDAELAPSELAPTTALAPTARATQAPAALGRSAAEADSARYASERLQEEVELLRRAQQLLRTDRALAAEALERYDVKFPEGAMRAEYDVLRRRLLALP